MNTSPPSPPPGLRAILAGAFALGAASVLGFAPFGWFPLPILALALLLGLWRRAGNPRRAAAVGFAFGLGLFVAGVSWVYVSLHEFGAMPAPLAAFATLLFCVYLAAFPAATGYCFMAAPGGSVKLALLFPAAWTLAEWVRGWLFTGFPWLALGYSQVPVSPLAGYAPVLGIYGVTLAAAATAGLLAAAASPLSENDEGGRRSAEGGKTRIVSFLLHPSAFLLAVLWLGGWALQQVEWTAPEGAPVRVSLLQGNVPQDLKWTVEQFVPTLELYRDLTYESAGSELVIWPEAAIPTLYGNVGDYLAEIQTWADNNGSEVMLGILRADPERAAIQNTIVALGAPRAFYVKRHLVPFGEYFPVPDFFRRWLRSMNLPYNDARPGPAGQPPLRIAGQQVAASICYEDVFGAEQLHYLPDATLLVNVSNDAWFGDSIAPHQHLQIARVRAAEAGRYLLRATNTGVSAIIDQNGRVVAASPQFEPHVLKGTVRGYGGATPYSRWGNYAVIIACVLVVAIQRFTTKFTMRPGT